MAATNKESGVLGELSAALSGAMGEEAGAMLNGFSQLQGLGLNMTQIEQAGETLLEQAEAAAGPQAMHGLVDAVPALKGHFGL
jgi:hypothetical protein